MLATALSLLVPKCSAADWSLWNDSGEPGFCTRHIGLGVLFPFSLLLLSLGFAVRTARREDAIAAKLAATASPSDNSSNALARGYVGSRLEVLLDVLKVPFVAFLAVAHYALYQHIARSSTNHRNHDHRDIWLATEAVQVAIWIAAFLAALIQVVRRVARSGVALGLQLAPLYLLSPLFVLPDVYHHFLKHDVPETLSLHDKIVLSILAGSMALFTLTIFTDRSSRPVKSDDGFERSYETYCSIFSAATFNWVTPTIRLGNKKRLDPEDLDILPTGDQAKIAYDRFKAEEREDRSFLKNLLWHHREPILYQFMYVVLYNVFLFAGPLCLNMLVQYFQNGRTDNKIVAYLWAVGIFVGPMLSSLGFQQQLWIGRRFSFRLKGIISQIVVEKTLKLPYQDRTVVLVTHHVSLVLGAAAHVAVIHEGTVVAQGKPADVVARGYVKDVSEADLREARELAEKSSTSHNDHSAATATNVEQGKLVEEEEREIGSVGWAVYKAFGDASGGSMFWALLLFVTIGFRMSTVLQDWWLRIWSSSYDTSSNAPIDADGVVASFTALFGLEPTTPAHSLYYYLSWFVFFGLIKIAVSVITQYFTLWSSINLIRTVHAALLRRLVNATPRFFDRTPLGRVISRFSSDMKALDQDAMHWMIGTLSVTISAILICAVISTTVPSFVVPGILVSLSGYFITVYYLNASREIKRIESTANAPLLSLYGELTSGVTTIRAYGVASRFCAEGDKYVDGYNRAFYMTWAANRWLCFLTDVLGASVSLVSALLILYNAKDYTAASAGFTLSYALSFSQTALWVVRFYGELEMNMNSMERIEQYMKVEQEAPGIIPNCRPPASWPHQGEVVVRGLHARYAPEAPQVIKGISFSTRPGERIGIVGRTGAGKSSLGLLLLRMLEAESGSIEIDGIDISKIGLQDLRKNVVIIPQDPVLFNGTIRSNLDPFDEHDDAV
ncbi:hypothetical protein GQ42DRAFT_181552, partial [Ramicandelaber brevisporus]